jgi:hypothetical protein
MLTSYRQYRLYISAFKRAVKNRPRGRPLLLTLNIISFKVE